MCNIPQAQLLVLPIKGELPGPPRRAPPGEVDWEGWLALRGDSVFVKRVREPRGPFQAYTVTIPMLSFLTCAKAGLALYVGQAISQGL